MYSIGEICIPCYTQTIHTLHRENTPIKHKNIHNNRLYFCSSLQLLFEQHFLFHLNDSRSHFFLQRRKCYLKRYSTGNQHEIRGFRFLKQAHINEFFSSKSWIEVHVRKKLRMLQTICQKKKLSLNFSYSSNCGGKVWSEVPTPHIHPLYPIILSCILQNPFEATVCDEVSEYKDVVQLGPWQS